MTNFINCYGCYENIEEQINMLNISGKTPILHQQDEKHFDDSQFQIMKNKILSIIEKTNLRYYYQQSNVEKGTIKIYGLYNTQFPFGYELFCRVQFMVHSFQISVFCSLLRNSIPFRVLTKANRIMINKFVLKANASMKFGCFRFNPINGEFALCLSSALTAIQFQSIMLYPNRLQQYLEQNFLKGKFFLKIYIYLILHLINELPQNFQKNPQVQQSKIKVLNSRFKQLENTLKKVVPTMHLQYPFMFGQNTSYSGSKAMESRELQQLANAITTTRKMISRPIHADIFNVVKKLVNAKNSTFSEEKFDDKDKKDFTKMLMEPVFRYPLGEIPNVYSQIQILNVLGEWQNIDKGGFGLILKNLVRYSYKPSPSNQNIQHFSNVSPQIFTKQLVKKQQIDPSRKKIKHEKLILSKLKNYTSPFIAKYYYSEQLQYKDSILIQYCAQKSLSIFQLRFNQFLTMQTKLHLLRCIAQGVKFLKDREIHHLDLKPSNILISSSLAKLIDFGQSHHPSLPSLNFRPGTSLPYSPPQSFSPFSIPFSPKMDIFSFGMLAYQLLYDHYPFDYGRWAYDYYRKLYSDKEYGRVMLLVPEKMASEGYRGIGGWIKNLVIRCLDREERVRPCVQWLLVLLQIFAAMDSVIYT